MQEEVDSDDDEYVYNPLKLPMGPDGKPIPYWLYKLHGLNQVPRALQQPPPCPHHAHPPRSPARSVSMQAPCKRRASRLDPRGESSLGS